MQLNFSMESRLDISFMWCCDTVWWLRLVRTSNVFLCLVFNRSQMEFVYYFIIIMVLLFSTFMPEGYKYHKYNATIIAITPTIPNKNRKINSFDSQSETLGDTKSPNF